MPRMFSSQRGPSLLAHWTPCPDPLSRVGVPIERILQDLGAFLRVSLRTSLAGLDERCQLVRHGLCLQVDTIVLVGRLGQNCHARYLVDGLSVRHNWVGHGELALGILLAQILQADLNMQLATSSDDVFAVLLCRADNKRI